jgi:hypothetical protein
VTVDVNGWWLTVSIGAACDRCDAEIPREADYYYFHARDKEHRQGLCSACAEAEDVAVEARPAHAWKNKHHPKPQTRQEIRRAADCPRCGALVGEACRSATGRRQKRNHAERVKAAQRSGAPKPGTAVLGELRDATVEWRELRGQIASTARAREELMAQAAVRGASIAEIARHAQTDEDLVKQIVANRSKTGEGR